MNLTQALSLCNSYYSTGQLCDRYGQPMSDTFNWDMVETLCPGCFIQALYEHTSFPLYLPSGKKWGTMNITAASPSMPRRNPKFASLSSIIGEVTGNTEMIALSAAALSSTSGCTEAK